MSDDPTWDFLDPASKGRLLGVLRREIEEMFELAAEPTRAGRPDRMRRLGAPRHDRSSRRRDRGLPVSVRQSRAAAASPRRSRSAWREWPKRPTLPPGRCGMCRVMTCSSALRDDTERLMHEFESLSDADWSGLMIPERYLGPLPAMIIVEGLLGGYTVHGWDVRQGLGTCHAIRGRRGRPPGAVRLPPLGRYRRHHLGRLALRNRHPHDGSERRRHEGRRLRSRPAVRARRPRRMRRDPRVRPRDAGAHRVRPCERGDGAWRPRSSRAASARCSSRSDGRVRHQSAGTPFTRARVVFREPDRQPYEPADWVPGAEPPLPDDGPVQLAALAHSAVDEDDDREEEQRGENRCHCRDRAPGLVEAEQEDEDPEREMCERGGPAEQVRDPIDAS